MSPACLRPSLVPVATLCLLTGACGRPHPDRSTSLPPPPDRSYLCLRASAPIQVDGRIEEREWAAAPWSEPFVDIEGLDRPLPELSTRMRMLWDDGFLYIAAEMEEPHLWGTLTERDAVIYRDDDFEVFLDPDGDTHDYYELEINVLGTIWDLMLTRPYRDAGRAIDAWDIRGIQTAVLPAGTVNDPADLDR